MLFRQNIITITPNWLLLQINLLWFKDIDESSFPFNLNFDAQFFFFHPDITFYLNVIDFLMSVYNNSRSAQFNIWYFIHDRKIFNDNIPLLLFYTLMQIWTMFFWIWNTLHPHFD